MLKDTSPELVASKPPSHPHGETLALRRDELLSGNFLVGLALVVALIAVGLRPLIRKGSKLKLADRLSGLLGKRASKVLLIETLRTSRKVSISLIDIDGVKAAVLESPQGASLTLIPAVQSTTAGNIASFEE